MFHAGTLISYFSYGEPGSNDGLIEALKVCANAIVLMDRDVEEDEGMLKTRVARISAEIDGVGGVGWITAGREVENYIPMDALQSAFPKAKLNSPGQFDRVFDHLEKEGCGKFHSRKVEFAGRICPHIRRASLATMLDMASRLDIVCKKLREWNGIHDNETSAS